MLLKLRILSVTMEEERVYLMYSSFGGETFSCTCDWSAGRICQCGRVQRAVCYRGTRTDPSSTHHCAWAKRREQCCGCNRKCAALRNVNSKVIELCISVHGGNPSMKFRGIFVYMSLYCGKYGQINRRIKQSCFCRNCTLS